MFNDEPFHTVKGVILTRKLMGENNLWSTLFLEGEGIVNVLSKNMLGDSEPFVWGYFDFRKQAKSRGYFLFDAEIKDDMFRIRRGKAPLRAATNWSKYLMRYLPLQQPDDELLNTLYWCMKLLTVPAVLPEAATWRFLRLWLEEWGLAPDLESFHAENGFNPDEIVLLSQVSALTPKRVIELFTGRFSPNIRENVFKIASNLALNFLNEI